MTRHDQTSTVGALLDSTRLTCGTVSHLWENPGERSAMAVQKAALGDFNLPFRATCQRHEGSVARVGFNQIILNRDLVPVTLSLAQIVFEQVSSR